MADIIPEIKTSADQMRANYEKYASKYKDSSKELVNSQTFLNLMIAEMTNQDPLEPTSNTEFVSQLAQFTQLTYAQDSSKYSMATYASSLVGKIATGSKMDGVDLVTKTGVVEAVTQSGNTYMVRVDGVDFDISKITAVKDRESGSVTSNALADSIAKAAGMVGMYATVEIGKDEETGKAMTKSGFIDSIKVKDGKITAVLKDINETWTIEHPIDKITEVTIATIYDEPDKGDNSDAADKEDGADGTDKTESTDET